MSARFGLRAAQTTFRQPALRQQVNTNFRFAQRRLQSTASETAEAVKNESGFAKFWNSPVGPKTVHFWAPIMKVRYGFGVGQTGSLRCRIFLYITLIYFS